MSEADKPVVLAKIDHKLAELLVLAEMAGLSELHRRLRVAADEVRRHREPSAPPTVPDL